jgi:hypothetical protein
LILYIAPSLTPKKIQLWLKDVTQAYTQADTALQRLILARLPEELQNQYPDEIIMVIVKPLYGIAEAGVHWFFTYFKYCVEKVQITILTYDPCLLVTKESAEGFGVVEMQTDDTLGLSDDKFATKEAEMMSFKAKKRQFLDHQNPIIFNGCMLTAGEITRYSCDKRTRHNDCKSSITMQNTSSSERAAHISPPSASRKRVTICSLQTNIVNRLKKKLPGSIAALNGK